MPWESKWRWFSAPSWSHLKHCLGGSCKNSQVGLYWKWHHLDISEPLGVVDCGTWKLSGGQTKKSQETGGKQPLATQMEWNPPQKSKHCSQSCLCRQHLAPSAALDAYRIHSVARRFLVGCGDSQQLHICHERSCGIPPSSTTPPIWHANQWRFCNIEDPIIELNRCIDRLKPMMLSKFRASLTSGHVPWTENHQGPGAWVSRRRRLSQETSTKRILSHQLPTTQPMPRAWYRWCFRNRKQPAWMVLKPCKWWNIYHINWWVCRISESSTVWNIWSPTLGQELLVQLQVYAAHLCFRYATFVLSHHGSLAT